MLRRSFVPRSHPLRVNTTVSLPPFLADVLRLLVWWLSRCVCRNLRYMHPEMMMTQSYNGFGEYDSHYQSSQQRSTSTPSYYDRLTPYSSVTQYANYDHGRHELRAGYGGRSVTRQIHDTEPDIAPGTARRRISVAVRDSGDYGCPTYLTYR